MTCTHTRWKHWPDQLNDWTGEMEPQESTEVSACEDISLGSFRCTKCGWVGYYTGSWKRYAEEGIPCPGSEGVSRNVLRGG